MPGQIVGYLAAALIGYAVVLLVLFVLQRHIIFPVVMVDRELAMRSVPGLEEVIVPTSDGERLRGYWRAPLDGGTVLVSFHGNGDAAIVPAMRFSARGWDGYGLLAVSYRGYPGSTGAPSEAGLLLDGEAALAYARQMAPHADLVLHGHSLGAAVAVAMSERHPSVALLLEAPFMSMQEMIRYRAPMVPDFMVLDPFRSDLRIRGSKAGCVMIAHGEDDRTIPMRYGRQLADLAPSAAFLPMAGRGHVTVLGAADERFRQGIESCRTAVRRPDARSEAGR